MLHDFTLRLHGIHELDETVENALFEAGCDDATLLLTGGKCYATFSREAESLAEAIRTAIEDVRRAGVGGEIEVASDR